MTLNVEPKVKKRRNLAWTDLSIRRGVWGVRATLLLAALLTLLLVGCAHGQQKPQSEADAIQEILSGGSRAPGQPRWPVLQVITTPRGPGIVGFAPMSVWVQVKIDDPDKVLRCPGFAIEYGDDSRSTFVGDCDPEVDNRRERYLTEPRLHTYNRAGAYVATVIAVDPALPHPLMAQFRVELR